MWTPRAGLAVSSEFSHRGIVPRRSLLRGARCSFHSSAPFSFGGSFCRNMGRRPTHLSFPLPCPPKNKHRCFQSSLLLGIHSNKTHQSQSPLPSWHFGTTRWCELKDSEHLEKLIESTFCLFFLNYFKTTTTTTKQPTLLLLQHLLHIFCPHILCDFLGKRVHCKNKQIITWFQKEMFASLLKAWT